jgi:hypothetical protein
MVSKVALFTWVCALPLAASAKGWQGANNLSLAGVVVGQTTMQQIVAKFGPATLHRGFDEPEASLCYRNAHGRVPTYVIFTTGPQVGWHTLTGFQLTSKAPAQTCQDSLVSFRALKTGNGIFLGQHANDFQRRFPVRFERLGLHLRYQNCAHEEATAAESATMQACTQWGACSRIDAEVKGDEVVSYKVVHTTSCWMNLSPI